MVLHNDAGTGILLGCRPFRLDRLDVARVQPARCLP
jgi:hypothetical protein